jgi:hypothetical protein
VLRAVLLRQLCGVLGKSGMEVCAGVERTPTQQMLCGATLLPDAAALHEQAPRSHWATWSPGRHSNEPPSYTRRRACECLGESAGLCFWGGGEQLHPVRWHWLTPPVRLLP